jgi:hypothetical protein
MNTELPFPLVFNLTSACIRRGVITLPGRYRSVLIPSTFAATDPKGNTYAFTVTTNFTLTGLLPFFSNHAVKPNDDVIFTPTDEPNSYRVHAVIKALRAPATPADPQGQAPATAIQRHNRSLTALAAQFMAVHEPTHNAKPVEQPPLPAAPELSVAAFSSAAASNLNEARVMSIMKMPPEEPQVQQETPTFSESYRSDVHEPTACTEEALLASGMEEQAREMKEQVNGFPAERPPSSPAYLQHEGVNLMHGVTPSSPERPVNFNLLTAQLVTYLLRSETPVIVRSEQIALELDESLEVIEKALLMTNISPALDVRELKRGVYRVNRLKVTAA